MGHRDWSRIATGETFEALVRSLLFREDSRAVLFGRRGNDGGQDALSGDGTTVYQAKHHADEKAARAISDAKSELESIRANRAPNAARAAQWQAVRRWLLVTNAAFNPADHAKWLRDIAPAFAAEGLVAEYWSRPTLDALLDKYPDIDRAYFENENRTLLSIPEARQRLLRDSVFLPRAATTPFCGRDAAIGAIRAFVASTKSFLVIDGSGGIGKSRLLVEAGDSIAAEGEWQVLWANLASMESGPWYSAIVPERPTLLLVDEPTDGTVLRQLVEQIGSPGRASKWKVVVAVRSPKDPVLRFLSTPQLQRQRESLSLGNLAPDDAKSLVRQLIEEGPLRDQPDAWKVDAASRLAGHFNAHPVWITLAIHLLERDGNLASIPDSAAALAEMYLSEIVNSQTDLPADKLGTLLRWLALLGTTNRGDDDAIRVLDTAAELGGSANVRGALKRLVERRVLVERGAYSRLVEIKPDVLRDHILVSWLVTDVRFGPQPLRPSDAAERIAESVAVAITAGSVSSNTRAILRAMARTEWLLRAAGRTVSILERVLTRVSDRISTLTATTRTSLVEALTEVADIRPADILRLSERLRTTPCDDEIIDYGFGKKTVTRTDVVDELPWLIFHAAMGAQDVATKASVIRELYALCEEEAKHYSDGRNLPNDGKRAAALLARVFHGGPQFWSDFGDSIESLALAAISRALAGNASLPTVQATAALLKCAVVVEREQSWSEGNVIHMRRAVITPGETAWVARQAILQRVRTELARDDLTSAAKTMLWEVIIEAHSSANRAGGQPHVAGTAALENEMRVDLEWAKAHLAARADCLEELKLARPLWDWHRQHDSDATLRGLAVELETIYGGNELAKEFEPLTDFDSWQEQPKRRLAKAGELAAAGSLEAISDFVSRARHFLGDGDKFNAALEVAYDLGSLASSSPSVAAFVRATLGEEVDSPRWKFAAVAGKAWTIASRKLSDAADTPALVRDLADACATSLGKARLLEIFYGGYPPLRSPHLMTAAEHDQLRSYRPVFRDAGRLPHFLQAVGWTFTHDWAALKELCRSALLELGPTELKFGLQALIGSLYWAVLDAKNTGAAVPDDIGVWLLELSLVLPCFDDLSGNSEWYLEEVIKAGDRPSVAWLASAIEHRIAWESAHKDLEGSSALSLSRRISKFVRKIGADDVPDAVMREGIRRLISFATEASIVGYVMPEYLSDIDPFGKVVGDEVASLIDALGQGEEKRLRTLARIAGAYGINSQAWRRIAVAAIRKAATLGVGEPRELFGTLIERGVTTWSSAPGQVPQLFIDKVEGARRLLSEEADPALRPFWEWRLLCAEHDLRRQEEEAREERGE